MLNWRDAWNSLQRGKTRRRPGRTLGRPVLLGEQLEDRRLLAITVTPSDDANALRDSLLAGVVTPGDAVLISGNDSAAFFEGGADSIGIESGIVLTSGSALDAEPPNDSDASSGTASGMPDADLDALFNVQTTDTTSLEFDFITTTGNIFFNFVFASEEYNEFANSAFNDAFALLIDGVNIALVPGTTTPISVNNVNGGNPFGTGAVNEEFFNNNDPGDGGTFLDEIGYDGFTDVFVAEATGLAIGTHTVKMTISDVSDTILDSAVFIEAESFADIVGLGGVKFHDLNGDGIRQPAEPGLSDWTIYIDANDNGVLDEDELSTITGANGSYSFEDLETGTYILREVLQPGWVQTRPASGSYVVDYVAGSVSFGNTFGNQRQGGVSGVKWHDLNEDGIRNPGEPGLAGWTIFVDVNGNGRFNSGEPFAVTKANGSYEIGSLDPVTYTIAEVMQPNWEQTFPGGDGTYTVNLFGGVDETDINFGNKGFASFEGVKFHDVNDNGQRDAGEPGLPGFYIYVDRNGNNIPNVGEPGAYSAADGSYEIKRVEPGSFAVREVGRPGWRQTAPSTGEHTVTVAAGEAVSGLEFGNTGGRDWGDAPLIYPTLAADLGAHHGIVPGFHLGPGAPGETKVDGETNGQPSSGATGDDTAAIDDEDGVMGLDTPLIAGTVKTITVIGSPAQDVVRGKLQAWVDFNADGDWADAGEQIVFDRVIATGPNTISFEVPASAAGGPTFARFRISYQWGLPYFGPATAGEVEDYLVNIQSDSAPFGSNAIDLGPIVDSTFADISVVPPGALVRVTATQTGIFTVLADFAHGAGNIDVAVYDAAGIPIGESNSRNSDERVDFDSVAGATYFIRLFGGNPDVDLQLVNMISTNSPLTIVGTPDADLVIVTAPKTSEGLSCDECVRVVINGTPYNFDARVELIYQGNGGVDKLTVNSNAYNDTIRFYADETEVLNPAYQIDTLGVEEVRVDGAGGTDRAWFEHMPGDDVVVIRQDLARRTRAAYLQQVQQVERVFAYSDAADADRAILYDSPQNDRLVARADLVRLSGEGYLFSVEDFRRVNTYATSGGTDDRAALYDSIGDDRLIARPDLARFRGEGFDNLAVGFERVNAYATAGGSDDRATLYDSPGDDTLVARPDYAVLRGADFHNDARGFDRVYAYATAGGNDRALLYDSTGNDTLVALPDYSLLRGAGFYNYARGFDRVDAFATAGGSSDYAVMYDSIGDDRFIARPEWARMEGSGFFNMAWGFDRVNAYATAGGSDRADMYDGSAADTFVGRDDYFYMLGSSYENRGTGFDSVFAYGLAGGINRLSVVDVLYSFTSIGPWI